LVSFPTLNAENFETASTTTQEIPQSNQENSEDDVAVFKPSNETDDKNAKCMRRGRMGGCCGGRGGGGGGGGRGVIVNNNNNNNVG